MKSVINDLFAESLFLTSQLSEEIGICSGTMGNVVYLFSLYHLTKNKKYELYGNELLGLIYDKISLDMPICYDNGLSGIGAGIEYIISNKFVKGCSNEVLYDIDLAIINGIEARCVNSLSFSKGICGIGFYLYLRLCSNINNENNIQILKNKEYIIYLIDWIEEVQTTNIYDFCDIYILLSKLRRFNLLNFKIDRIIDYYLELIIKYRAYDILNKSLINYECLGVVNLSLLKSWK